MLSACSLLVLLLSLLPGQSLLADQHLSNTTEQVLTAIRKGVEFFSSDTKHINLDGLFGLQIGQGQILKILEEKRPLANRLTLQLKQLSKLLSNISQDSFNNALRETPAYTKRFKQIVERPFISKYTPHHFGPLQPNKEYLLDQSYDEVKGDNCLSSEQLSHCLVTKECIGFMTRTGTGGYFITHQLLYFIFIEQFGCEKETNEFLRGKNIKTVQTELCHQIYRGALYLAKDGDVYLYNQDLFLEETLLCGMLGFEDFMKPEWIQMVLSWQDTSGCFKNTINEKGSRFSMRKPLREQDMKDGCLSHKSGLGFGTLSTYLYYLLY